LTVKEWLAAFVPLVCYLNMRESLSFFAVSETLLPFQATSEGYSGKA